MQKKLQILMIVGTRPEIIKLAPVVRAVRSNGLTFGLVHTGQHYDDNLDAVFFRQLDLPAPMERLEIGSAEREVQIERVRAGLGATLEREPPEVVVLQGDTNSVLGAALAARDAGIPIAHVEAGLRCGDLAMPEECNRRETDRRSSLLFAPTEHARDALLDEGQPLGRVFVTGNTVIDELQRCLPKARALGEARRCGLEPGRFGLVTLHRQEGVDDPAILERVLRGLREAARELGLPLVLPLHPRTRRRIEQHGLRLPDEIRPLDPLGYLPFLSLLADAQMVWTDSGGVQEEACSLGVPCVVLRDSTERPEAVEVGASHLAGRTVASILAASRSAARTRRGWSNPFGDGKAGERCVSLIRRFFLH